MKGVYTTVANEIFAHAVYTRYPVIYDLMKNLEFEEVEKALNSIWHVYAQIWQLYENGRQPEARIMQYPYKGDVFMSVAKQVGCKC